MSNTYEIPIDEMDVDEMRGWLMGDDERAVEWRQDPQNRRLVSEMTNRLAGMEGGLSRRAVNNHLAQERKRLEREAEAEEAKQARMERLYAVAKADWITNGGVEAEFEREWSSLRKELLRTGRAEKLLEEQDAERRARAARTF